MPLIGCNSSPTENILLGKLLQSNIRNFDFVFQVDTPLPKKERIEAPTEENALLRRSHDAAHKKAESMEFFSSHVANLNLRRRNFPSQESRIGINYFPSE